MLSPVLGSCVTLVLFTGTEPPGHECVEPSLHGRFEAYGSRGDWDLPASSVAVPSQGAETGSKGGD